MFYINISLIFGKVSLNNFFIPLLLNLSHDIKRILIFSQETRDNLSANLLQKSQLKKPMFIFEDFLLKVNNYTISY